MTPVLTINNTETTKLTKDDIQAFIEGDRAAFQKVYALTYKFVFYTIFYMVGNNQSEAEDLTHDVYIKLYDARHKVNHTLSFEGWVKRMAVNHTLNSQKRYQIFLKKMSHIFYHTDSQTESDALASNVSDGDNTLQLLIQDLPPNDRMVLILKEINGLSHKQIAETINATVNTVQVRLHRAKKRLLRAYETHTKEVVYG